MLFPGPQSEVTVRQDQDRTSVCSFHCTLLISLTTASFLNTWFWRLVQLPTVQLHAIIVSPYFGVLFCFCPLVLKASNGSIFLVLQRQSSIKGKSKNTLGRNYIRKNYQHIFLAMPYFSWYISIFYNKALINMAKSIQYYKLK